MKKKENTASDSNNDSVFNTTISTSGTVAMQRGSIKPSKKSMLSLTTKHNMAGLLFILPFIIGLIVVFLPSLIQSFTFGFNNIINSTTGYSLEFKGWEYYNNILFVNPTFVRGIFESTGTMFLNVVIILIYSLMIATILNRNIKGKGFYRALLFLPVVITTGIIVKMDADTLLGTGSMAKDMATGEVMGGLFSSVDIKVLISSLNINEGFTSIIVSAANNVYTIISTSGVQLVIFLAGLQAISPAIYESATVEGCTWWESFWKITIPMISPLILVNLVYTVVDSFTQYDNSVMKQVYKMITTAQFSVGSAMAFFYLLVVGIVLSVVLGISSRFVFYENK